MRSNRVFFYSDNSHFADDLLRKLEEKYDVDEFHSARELLNAANLSVPVAVISTVNTSENFEMMKNLRGVLFKSQWLEEYNAADATKYGRYCAGVAGRCWEDEILNASFQIIDKNIVEENVDKALRKRIDDGTAKPYELNFKDVRTKTKESQRLPAAARPEMLAEIMRESEKAR